MHHLTREVQVPRIVGAYAAGRIINPMTARSQLLGGMIWGVSSALYESTEIGRRNARYTNDNFTEYLIPVNADIAALRADRHNGEPAGNQRGRRVGWRWHGRCGVQRDLSRHRRAHSRIASPDRRVALNSSPPKPPRKENQRRSNSISALITRRSQQMDFANLLCVGAGGQGTSPKAQILALALQALPIAINLRSAGKAQAGTACGSRCCLHKRRCACWRRRAETGRSDIRSRHALRRHRSRPQARSALLAHIARRCRGSPMSQARVAEGSVRSRSP